MLPSIVVTLPVRHCTSPVSFDRSLCAQLSLQASPTHRSTQHISSKCVGTLAGFSMPGVSDFIQARKARIRLFLSSTALPNHSFLRLGQVHSRKARAETSSGVWGDFPLYADHSLMMTGGAAGKDSAHQIRTHRIYGGGMEDAPPKIT